MAKAVGSCRGRTHADGPAEVTVGTSRPRARACGAPAPLVGDRAADRARRRGAFAFSEHQTKAVHRDGIRALRQPADSTSKRRGSRSLQPSPAEDPTIMATNIQLLTHQPGVAADDGPDRWPWSQCDAVR